MLGEDISHHDLSAEALPRVEAGKNTYGLLVIVTQPKLRLGNLELSKYDEWFVKAIDIDPAQVRVVNVTEEPLPTTVPQSGIIIGGSAHSTYEKGVPWIAELEEFIRTMDKQQKPMLGVCFGHQMVAQALGGKVERGKNGREIGVTSIELTDQGKKDPLFKGLPQSIELATSHSDVVTVLPPRGDIYELASNGNYPYQALAIGDTTRTIQPHPEITCDIISTIATARKDVLIKEGISTTDTFGEFLDEINRRDIATPGRKILQNFNNNFVVPYHRENHI